MKLLVLTYYLLNLIILQNNPIVSINKLPLKTVQGKPFVFSINASQKATVIMFISPQCPLCQSYSLTINQLYQQYAKEQIRFVAIIPGKSFTQLEISTFKNKYKMQNIEFYIDEELQLTQRLNATITPEVFVINPKQQLIYQGRIDNWAYELGKKRAVITEHNLKYVLENVVNDKPVIYTKTKAVGCFIE
ncbi:MAG: redoxin domain-containing protein [Bacteroidia bacterium]